ncbi:radical SAM protein [Thermodesulfobacteriota bacterium]
MEGSAEKTFCGQSHQLRVSYVGPHHGEEPPISGKKGSGTIFFSGCSLKCSYCQNHQISRDGIGNISTVKALFEKAREMIQAGHVRNINFVTPDHFLPHVFNLVTLIKENGIELPILLNTSGYQSIEMLRLSETFVDIYLPDYKYSDNRLSMKLSGCRDYPQRALDAISKMIKQKGFLDSFEENKNIAEKGVLVRHLILPGKIENSKKALDTLFLEFGKDLPLSLMSQYRPVINHEDGDLNRPISNEEFDAVYSHALNLGFKNMFVQFPDEYDVETRHDFLPDFNLESPFKGNMEQ